MILLKILNFDFISKVVAFVFECFVIYSEDYYGDVDLKALKKLGF